ncbi:MAG: TlpA disulfide reductase family protein [Candidatus Electryonea clarkiae]|nr:TlpA disulfide reductase family protein [Candidatus Electryonea clarkiae]MDP8288412.1 TlpA disulfide reductase family protein [Candidatus Electryonea clarkiae]
MKIFYYPLIVFGVLTLSILYSSNCVFAEDSTAEMKVSEGDILEPFMLPIYGQRGKYGALRDYCGEPRPTRPNEPRRLVVLSFFASYCVPCKKEIPELERLAGEWGNEVSVLLISVGNKIKDIDKWKLQNKTNLPIFMDPYKATSVERYGVSTIPTLVILDKKGVIQYIHRGYKPGDEIEADKVVRKLLAE